LRAKTTLKKRLPNRTQVDLSFTKAAQVLIAQREQLKIFLVGCGGTGSWLAPAIARLAKVLTEEGRRIQASFIDPDLVEAKNIPRQNFCSAELGRNKAVALAGRYGSAWAIEIEAVPARFTAKMLPVNSWQSISIIVGCVDNAAARKSIAGALKAPMNSNAPSTWWLDCGNAEESGQVLLGSAPDAKSLKVAFNTAKTCTALPGPGLQCPDLLTARPEEKGSSNLSCAEMMAANIQSLAINQRVAAEAADYLMRLCMGKPLKRFATYFDLATGSAKSLAVTPEAVSALIKRPVEFLTAKTERR
jgi:PRTRC genetic system ThiF family protein